MSTKDGLPLNREKLTKKAVKCLCEDIDEVIKIFFDLLSADYENIKVQKKIVDAYYLSCWLYKREFPVDLKEHLSMDSKYRVLKCSDDGYKVETTSLKELSSTYPNLYYLKNETNEARVFADEMYSLNKLIEIVNAHKDVVNSELVVIDETLKEYLQATYSGSPRIPRPTTSRSPWPPPSGVRPSLRTTTRLWSPICTTASSLSPLTLRTFPLPRSLLSIIPTSSNQANT